MALATAGSIVSRPHHTLLLALWCASLCMAHEGGCHGEPGQTRPSPVNAIGMVLEHADGTIDARLTLRSDTVAAAVPVAGTDVTLSRGDVSVVLEGEPGSYAAAVDELDYEPELPFTMGFTIGAAAAREASVYAGRFTLSAHGPWERPDAWLEGNDLFWTPGGLPAYVEVRDRTGTRLWQSFDPQAADPDYEALATGGMRLPHEVLPGAMEGVVVVCAVERMGRDELTSAPQHVAADVVAEGQLGWLSAMIVGRCTHVAVP